MDPKPVNVRIDYGDRDLDVSDLAADPLAQLQTWLAHAARSDQLVEPSATALATVDAEGRPTLRTVLVRGITEGRLVFFTNYGSRKAQHIAADPHVCLLFRWANPPRQVELIGTAAPATSEESDAYFATRPRDSQIGAHVSPQSRPLASREELETRVAEVTASFEDVAAIPRPQDWGGYAVTPTTLEFWQGRHSRLHDRIRYDLQPDQTWTRTRLAP